MNLGANSAGEIFSFHLVKLSGKDSLRSLFAPMHRRKIPGLMHSERFLPMSLGRSIVAPGRYWFGRRAFFFWWRDAVALEEFLRRPEYECFTSGWHMKLRLYRRWGEISELRSAVVNPRLMPSDAAAESPVAAFTLARLNLWQTLRFVRWGAPVESQVRDHPGQIFALAGIRPLGTFCTFSLWKSEAEMVNMVQGRRGAEDGESHRVAMRERARKDFHWEFTTMRFVPVGFRV